MSGPNVLLTGASGSLGSNVLEKLIEANYTVDAVLRSLTRSKPFLAHKYAAAVASGQLTFTEIADMTAPGAFDAGLSNASYLLHVATPLGFDNFEETVFQPAEKLMSNILQSAKRSTTLKRVVITGSIVSTMRLPNDMMSNRVISSADYNDIPLAEATTDVGAAYQYSKVTAEKQAWAFMKREKPQWDLVFHLTPSITGRSIQQGWRSEKTGLGGMSSIYRSLFDREAVTMMVPHFLDVDDVAFMHVKSLDTAAVPGNKRYLASAGIIDSNDVARKIREEFPQLRNRVPEPAAGTGIPDALVTLDLAETDEVFGTAWKGGWETARATVLDILTTEKKYGVAQDKVEDILNSA
ncbi:NAD(P)-binding protein [Clathrospora elynae]|uniref:NAD(P)-binding protein n=1 Tax=Clathrospora elynae TaxID=706981 RepID=A0A6A5SM97_9PLEO|nr:NAD(P)-binding protein [Clathrospora elynae]